MIIFNFAKKWGGGAKPPPPGSDAYDIVQFTEAACTFHVGLPGKKKKQFRQIYPHPILPFFRGARRYYIDDNEKNKTSRRKFASEKDAEWISGLKFSHRSDILNPRGWL